VNLLKELHQKHTRSQDVASIADRTTSEQTITGCAVAQALC